MAHVHKTNLELPDDVHRGIAAAANALATTKTDLVVRALRDYLPTVPTHVAQSYLGEFRALPADYHRSAARVYRALVDLGGGPVSSVQLAEYVGLHYGNVNKHLTRLRSDGYVERTAQGHRIVPTDATKSEQSTPPSVG